MIVRSDGLDAVTEVTRVAHSRGQGAGLTLVRCRLLTGRTHQIRVHLQAEGLPIVGDPVYRGEVPSRLRDTPLGMRLLGFPRQALHASLLQFVHPVSGATVCVEAPLPPDMAMLLAEVGLAASGRLPA